MRLASIDGRIVPEEEATIPVTDAGLLRGDGVFEVLRLYDGRPFAVVEHMARMRASAANLRLECDVQAVAAEIEALLDASDAPTGMVRALVTRGGRRIVLVEDLPDHGETISLAPVTYAPSRVLDGVKSLSYAANMLATRLAKEQGADEALLVTPHGRVLEAPTSSFFWVSGDRILTPPLSEHLLDSITRRLVIELMDAHEAVATLDDVLAADEAFLASTTREVHAVAAIAGHSFDAPGPVTAEASARVSERVRELVAR